MENVRTRSKGKEGRGERGERGRLPEATDISTLEIACLYYYT